MHTRISQGVRSPLTATAIALESRYNGKVADQAIIISCDLISVPEEILDGVRRNLKDCLPEFDGRKIIIRATSLMRLAPVPMFYFNKPLELIEYCVESSRTTHGALECLDACRMFGGMLHRALGGAGKEESLFGGDLATITSPKILGIGKGSFRHKSASEIKGSGYVVSSLEAALWCFWKSDSFDEAVLESANLGDDADTTAAICGQLAGAHYGDGAIPQLWKESLAMRELILDFADRLFIAGGAAY